MSLLINHHFSSYQLQKGEMGNNVSISISSCKGSFQLCPEVWRKEIDRKALKMLQYFTGWVRRPSTLESLAGHNLMLFSSQVDTYLKILHLFSVTSNLTKPGEASTAGSEGGEGESELLEALSLKERMARYQAAVSRGDARSFSANVSNSAELCIR